MEADSNTTAYGMPDRAPSAGGIGYYCVHDTSRDTKCQRIRALLEYETPNGTRNTLMYENIELLCLEAPPGGDKFRNDFSRV